MEEVMGRPHRRLNLLPRSTYIELFSLCLALSWFVWIVSDRVNLSGPNYRWLICNCAAVWAPIFGFIVAIHTLGFVRGNWHLRLAGQFLEWVLWVFWGTEVLISNTWGFLAPTLLLVVVFDFWSMLFTLGGVNGRAAHDGSNQSDVDSHPHCVRLRDLRTRLDILVAAVGEASGAGSPGDVGPRSFDDRSSRALSG